MYRVAKIYSNNEYVSHCIASVSDNNCSIVVEDEQGTKTSFDNVKDFFTFTLGKSTQIFGLHDVRKLRTTGDINLTVYTVDKIIFKVAQELEPLEISSRYDDVWNFDLKLSGIPITDEVNLINTLCIYMKKGLITLDADGNILDTNIPIRILDDKLYAKIDYSAVFIFQISDKSKFIRDITKAVTLVKNFTILNN